MALMRPVYDMASQQVFKMSEIEVLAKLFHDETGIVLGNSKNSLIESRLRKRILDLQIDGAAYIQLVLKDPKEKQIVIDMLTTHKTDWYREMIHYHFISEWLQKEGRQLNEERPLMFWSAASSTGEEAYTMAIHLIDQGLLPTNFKILGSDISTDCLKKASNGIFPFKILSEQVPFEQIRKNFTKVLGQNGEKQVQINQDIREIVKFRMFNVYSQKMSHDLQFDVVFLRNILIYFSPEKATTIIQNLCKNIRVGGYIVLGLSEGLPGTGISSEAFNNLESCGSSIYRKIRP